MNKISNIKEFKYRLPYASELFGVYQPLLGWKSKRIQKRITKGFYIDKAKMMNVAYSRCKGEYKVNLDEDFTFDRIANINVGEIVNTTHNFDTILMQEIEKILPTEREMNDEKWKELINKESLTHMLSSTVTTNLTKWMAHGELPQTIMSIGERIQDDKIEILKGKVNRESVVAGVLSDLIKNEQYDHLNQIFYRPKYDISPLLNVAKYKDPFEYLDPSVANTFVQHTPQK